MPLTVIVVEDDTAHPPSQPGSATAKQVPIRREREMLDLAGKIVIVTGESKKGGHVLVLTGKRG